MSKRWIGVDLDGTLAYSTTPGKIGKPVPAMLKRVKDTIEAGTEVRIFTARAMNADGIATVRKWLKANDLAGLPVTNVKDGDMLELWDDRARRVVRDKGAFCAGCDKENFARAATVLTDC